MKLKSGKWRNDHSLIDPEREGEGHSFAYLHHLVKAHEPLAPALVTLYNIEFMVGLAARLVPALRPARPRELLQFAARDAPPSVRPRSDATDGVTALASGKSQRC